MVSCSYFLVVIDLRLQLLINFHLATVGISAFFVAPDSVPFITKRLRTEFGQSRSVHQTP